MNTESFFDINIAQGRWEQLNDGELAELIPTIDVANLRNRLKNAPFGGPLGLQLSRHIAVELICHLYPLSFSDSGGYLFSVGYHHPRILKPQAEKLARSVLQHKIQEEYPHLHFFDVQYAREHTLWWSFAVSCEEWADRIPGALFASIDKIDGHHWSSEEMAEYWKENMAKELVLKRKK